MSWHPRRAKPGMVRVSHRNYIALLQGALKAQGLEVQSHLLEARHRAAVRRGKALDLLAGRGFPTKVVQLLTEDLPQRCDGTLHEEGFRALIEEQEWRRRLDDLTPADPAVPDAPI